MKLDGCFCPAPLAMDWLSPFLTASPGPHPASSSPAPTAEQQHNTAAGFSPFPGINSSGLDVGLARSSVLTDKSEKEEAGVHRPLITPPDPLKIPPMSHNGGQAWPCSGSPRQSVTWHPTSTPRLVPLPAWLGTAGRWWPAVLSTGEGGAAGWGWGAVRNRGGGRGWTRGMVLHRCQGGCCGQEMKFFHTEKRPRGCFPHTAGENGFFPHKSLWKRGEFPLATWFSVLTGKSKGKWDPADKEIKRPGEGGERSQNFPHQGALRPCRSFSVHGEFQGWFSPSPAVRICFPCAWDLGRWTQKSWSALWVVNY